MARSFTAALRAAMFGQETSDGVLLLLTIEHDELPQPLRFAAAPFDVTSRGHVFTASPFDVQLPDDEEDQAALARLTADNVGRALVPVLRTLTSSPLVTIEVVKISDPDTVEIRIPKLQAIEPTTPDPFTMTCDLTVPDLSQQRYGTARYLPSSYPALARAA